MRRIKLALRRNERVYHRVRMALQSWRSWRMGLKHVDPTAYINPDTDLHPTLTAKAYSFVNYGCIVTRDVEIGRYTMLAPRVAIVGGDHRIDQVGVPIIFQGREEIGRTVIGDDCWLGYGSVILAGVKIGDGAVIAAGSVVTKDVPAYEIHGGVPARKLRDRFATVEDRLRHEAMLAQPVFVGNFCPPT